MAVRIGKPAAELPLPVLRAARLACVDPAPPVFRAALEACLGRDAAFLRSERLASAGPFAGLPPAVWATFARGRRKAAVA